MFVSMEKSASLLEALGGEAGCRRLSREFYTRVGNDPILHRLFPGKSLRCATEEFGAFLIQFLGGDEEQTQYRWWLSLRESHARFRIGAVERSAWLDNMVATLAAAPLNEETKRALQQFFSCSSYYLLKNPRKTATASSAPHEESAGSFTDSGRTSAAFALVGKQATEPEQDELAARWREQCALDAAIDAITSARDDEAVALAQRFTARPSVFVGLLARMIQTGRLELVRFVNESVRSDTSLVTQHFSGRTVLHFACGAGCVEVVDTLLGLGADPNVQDRGGHTPLYSVANECASERGPKVVQILVRAGADVNARGGVTRASALHMAARRGNLEIARTLLDCGASADLQDRKGDTPLDRALKCRRNRVAELLMERSGRLQ
jgi:truncated hemoglobin YjbI